MAGGIVQDPGTGVSSPIVDTDRLTREGQLRDQQVIKVALGATGVVDKILDAGQKTMAGSLPVAIASDQGAIPVTDNAGSLTVDAPTATPVPAAITTTADVLVKPGDSVNNAIRVNIVAGAGSGGTSAVDNSVFTGGTTNVTPMGAIFDATPPTITDGNVGAPRMSSTRILLVDGSGATQPVSGTVAATQSGAWSLSANQSVNVAQINGITPLMGNGVTGTGSQRVTIASDNTAFSVNATASQATAANLNAEVQGDAASGAAKSGNPVQIGGVFNTTQPTVTTGQMVEAQSTARGAQIVATGVDTFAVTASQATAANLKAEVVGTKTNNAAAPGATNVGALTAVATAAAPTYTEGNLVGLSTDLAGALRTAGGAGGTQYTEDAVAATDPIGTQPVMTRRDTPTALVSANLDVVSQQGTNFGAAYVQVVTSGGAFVDAFGGSGGTAQADKSAFTEGTTNFTPVGGVFNETITADPTEDQAAAARITAKRAIHVNLRGSTGLELGVSGGSLFMKGALSHDSAGSGVEPLAIGGYANAAAPADVSADLDIVRAWFLRNGAQATVITAAGALIGGDAANGLDVDITRSVLPTGASTLAEQQTQTTSLQLLDDVVIADNAAFTDGTTKLDMAGFIFDETAGTALTENDAAAARVDSKRAIVVTLEDTTTRGTRAAVTANGLQVQQATAANLNATVTVVPATSNGLSMSHTVSAASTNATSLKASAGKVYAVQVFNLNAAARYFKLYNKASAPTVGTDTPVKVIMIPGNTAGAGAIACEWTNGLDFTTGIAWALTTGITNADTGAVAASEILVEIDYK